MTLRFCLVCNVLGIGFCSQDVTSAQVTSTAGGGGIDGSLEETEVIWKELLSQEWRSSISTASFRSLPLRRLPWRTVSSLV